MAALNRPTKATYVVHDEISIETADHEDHTFCGIMFPVKCKDLLPVDHIVIRSLAVRGRLGPLTVWVSKEASPTAFRMNPKHWTKVYEQTHRASPTTFVTLNIEPIRLHPGETKALYVHSTLPGDQSIVYDDRHRARTYDDNLVSVLTGRAHVSCEAFGTTPIWGWGNPWRDDREFVGRLDYGAVYKLWNPTSTVKAFGSNFGQMVVSLLSCQRRWESPVSLLPDDVIFYILNMCRWDWANDTAATMKEVKKKRRAMLTLTAAATSSASATTNDTSLPAAFDAAPTAASPASTACCNRTCAGQDNAEEEDEDEMEAVEEEESYDENAEDDSDSEEEEEEWDSDSEYSSNANVFTIRNDDSDEEEEQEEDTDLFGRPWRVRTVGRVQVLNALASLQDGAVFNPRRAGF
jgi:hypothetical protein